MRESGLQIRFRLREPCEFRTDRGIIIVTGEVFIRRFLLVTAMMIFAALHTFASDCASVIEVRQRTQDGRTEFTARNFSSKPMVAYVVAAGRDANGNPTNVFYGVFTAGDSLRPGASMAIGSVSSNPGELKLAVDYVRRPDGWHVVTLPRSKRKMRLPDSRSDKAKGSDPIDF